MTKTQPKIDPAQALAMYDDHATDREIADRFGVDKSAVAHWRARRNLPTKNSIIPSAEKYRKARQMLRDGASKQQIADETGMHPSTVQTIRRSMPKEGLRKAGAATNGIRYRAINDNDLYPRILRAIGASLPRDIKHDAANEMYVDVLDGRLSADLIEARASRYRTRAWNICGSNYGPVSLDAANDDGFSLGDVIEDTAAIEAMEDAAERVWGQGKMLR